MKYLYLNLLPIILLGLFLIPYTKSYAQESNDTYLMNKETGEEIMQREIFIYTRRAGGPGMTIPEGAYSHAVYQKSLLPEYKNIYNNPNGTVNWVSVNPIGLWYARTNNNYISGRTNSIDFHPSNPNIFYIAAAQGGVWKTTDGGVTWQNLTDNLSSLSGGDIAIDNLNPNVLYYGTGELNYSGDSHYGDGIFKSTNAGTSWTKIATISQVGSYIAKIIVDPNNSNIVFCAGGSGVFKSTNAGLNWTTSSTTTNCNSLIMDPTNTQILYISPGGTSNGKVFKTTDGGGSWNLYINGLPVSGLGRISLAMAPSNHLVLYASVANPSGSLNGLYETIDGGNNWTLQASTPNYLGSQGWYDNGVCVKTSDPNTVITGGLDLYVSTNSGVTLVQKSSWFTTSSNNFTHADIHYLTYNGTDLYCCSDGGVYKSTDDGTTWTDLNHFISTLQYESADYDITNLQRLYGGTQDNDKETSTDGGNTWIQRTTGDGGYTIVDPVNTNYIYGQYVNGSIQRSVNSGLSYSEIRPSGSSGGLFYNPYEMAPGDHNTIVFGRADVWKTTNAQTCTQTSGWTQIATTSVTGGNVSAIGISATNINKIYIGTSNGKINVTTDNGTTWATQSGFPYVSDFAVDMTNDNICYATFGGTYTNRISKTTDGGATWTSISSGLPSIAVNSVILRNTAPRMLFLGTDLGVYTSTNDGANWAAMNSGLPTMQVYDMKYKEQTGVLLIATHGRGCWTFNVNALIGVSTNTEIVKSFDLRQNYPNPFNPGTKISFSIPEAQNVKLTVFDIVGNEVGVLINNRLNAGTHELTWDASKYASGVYFYKIETEQFSETKKMLLVK